MRKFLFISIVLSSLLASADQQNRSARANQSLEEFRARVEQMDKGEKARRLALNIVTGLATCVEGGVETVFAGFFDAVPLLSAFAKDTAHDRDEARGVRSVLGQEDEQDRVDRRDGGFERNFDIYGGGVGGTVRALIEAAVRYIALAAQAREPGDVGEDFIRSIQRSWSTTELTARNNLGTNSICSNSIRRIQVIIDSEPREE